MTPMAIYIYKNVIQVVRNCPLILKAKKTFINREAELDGDGKKGGRYEQKLFFPLVENKKVYGPIKMQVTDDRF